MFTANISLLAVRSRVSDVVVYTTDHCPFCEAAKRLLAARGVTYKEIHLGRDPEGRGQLVSETGAMTFPQVVIDGELIGGFDALRALDQAGGLPPARA